MHDPDGRKGGPGFKLTEEQVARALDQAGGLKSMAARLLGVEWHTVQRAVRRWPGLQEVLDQAREMILDEAELSLRKLVREGNLGAICFTLKCQGKKRGWVERQEITGAGGGPLEVQPSFPVHRLSIETQRRLLEELEALEAEQKLGKVLDLPPEPKRIPGVVPGVSGEGGSRAWPGG